MLSFRKTLNLVIPYKNIYYFGLFKDVNVNPVDLKQIKQELKQQKGGQLPKIHFKSQDANTIDEINKYFQGIRVNTKYGKFYNQDSISKIYSCHEVRKITDLPFVHQQSVMNNMIIGSKVHRACQPILDKIKKAELKQKILQMSTGFFIDIFEKKRTVKIQPNFEREARKVINSLSKSGYQFNLVKNQKVKVQIKGSELIRGVEVTRNNNYSIDSYQIVKQNQYTFYRLWQKGTYKIPEQEWRTQNNIILRINAKISSPYQITITQGTNKIVSNNHHFFVFQMDLKNPPRFCQFSTPQKQYFSKYRTVLDNLTITNVDQRNRFTAYVYEEKEKKEKLINKII